MGADITMDEVMTYLKKSMIEGPIPDRETYQRHKRCEYTEEELEVVKMHLAKHPEIIESIRSEKEVYFYL